jgi:hypothetical protein
MDIVFDENTGLLMPGEHKLTIEEFEKVFVHNDKRRLIFSGFQKLIEIFKHIECSHLYADGSFVTKKPFPSDIDICWHMDEDRDTRNKQLEKLIKICKPLFFLKEKTNREFIQNEFYADVFPANTIEGGSGLMFKDFFQRDKDSGEQKGIIIIDLI